MPGYPYEQIGGAEFHSEVDGTTEPAAAAQDSARPREHDPRSNGEQQSLSMPPATSRVKQNGSPAADDVAVVRGGPNPAVVLREFGNTAASIAATQTAPISGESVMADLGGTNMGVGPEVMPDFGLEKGMDQVRSSAQAAEAHRPGQPPKIQTRLGRPKNLKAWQRSATVWQSSCPTARLCPIPTPARTSNRPWRISLRWRLLAARSGTHFRQCYINRPLWPVRAPTLPRALGSIWGTAAGLTIRDKAITSPVSLSFLNSGTFPISMSGCFANRRGCLLMRHCGLPVATPISFPIMPRQRSHMGLNSEREA